MDSNEKFSQTFVLKDGRKLGFEEYGDLDGKPVIYFPGPKSSRLEPKMWDFNILQHKCHLIAIERPEIGLSDFKKGNTFLNWPDAGSL